MNELNNGQTQGIISGMLQRLQETVPANERDFTLSEDTEVPTQSAAPEGDVIELSTEFDYEGFQVVRREFFAHTNEPSITFNNYKVYVNAACLARFQTVDFVQVLVNSDSKILAIRPCGEEERDAFSWCVPGSGRRKPRQITCRLFFAKVFSLMEWNTDYRYKLLGKVIHANGEYLIAFDLSATEVYQRVFKDGEKPKTSRTPVFPEGWQNQFGLPFKEHRNSMQINIFDGYAVYGIKENATTTPEHSDSPSDNLPSVTAHNNNQGGSNA
ncbi:MAG: hypothetical protein PHE09_01335 [Oscillospiraceae bacterium]|nr:hypothetical protein [Oscillospiraceae bacterium]